jgi:hypothetical protein
MESGERIAARRPDDQRGGGSERRIVALSAAAAKLLRAYSLRVETPPRPRHGGDQHSVSSISTSMMERSAEDQIIEKGKRNETAVVW